MSLKTNQLNPFHKNQIIEILCESFDENQSVNFVIKQDSKRVKRIKILMEYSLYKGIILGEIYYDEKNQACAIILDKNKSKTTIKSIIWDIQLLFQCIGIKNIIKVLKREKEQKKLQPKNPFLHLWYLGVSVKNQGLGIGSNLIQEIIKDADVKRLPIFLETSTKRNFPFYEKNGFTHLNTLHSLGYELRTFIK
jgi:hypothetical protein